MFADAMLPAVPKFAFPPGLASRDRDRVVSQLSSQLLPHEMKVLSGTVNADIRCIDMGPLSLSYIEYGASVEISPARLGSFFLIHANFSGTTTVTSDRGTRLLHGHNLVVSGPGEHVTYRMTPACRHLTVKIDAEVLCRSAGVDQDDSALLMTRLTDEIVLREWNPLVLHLASMSPLIEGAQRKPAILEHLAASLVDVLLGAVPGATRPLPGATPWYVRKARDFIEQHAYEPLSCGRVAQAVGISVRSLQHGFMQVHGISPADYIRNLRLEHLHQALLYNANQNSVTDIMSACGITSFGRYSRYYYRKYDCSPSTTLRRSASIQPAK